ncbi:hypothetical protein ABZX85_12540 [Streptomyces sp. NPDC004539]|uniref:hypothetical protein n=1 Tax=Streptomyces sp. NPDC004539 TaxID=3154280 RepID=UPI0033BDEA9A
MMVRRPSQAAGVLAVLACALLAACDSTSHPTSSAVGSPSPATSSGPSPEMKTLPPSRLCAVLTADAARGLVTGARLTSQVAPDQGPAPDVCTYTAADGAATVSLTPATRAYAAELAAAHSLRADPAPAGMSGVRVDTVTGLGTRAFRETAYQTQTGQRITFTVWDAGTRTWVLTYATAAGTPGAPPAVADDAVVKVAKSLSVT